MFDKKIFSTPLFCSCFWIRDPRSGKNFRLSLWQGLIAGVNDTGDKYSFPNISENFRKNSKRPQWNTWGPGGHWFMNKTWSRKSRVWLPLRFFPSEFRLFRKQKTLEEEREQRGLIYIEHMPSGRLYQGVTHEFRCQDPHTSKSTDRCYAIVVYICWHLVRRLAHPLVHRFSK